MGSPDASPVVPAEGLDVGRMRPGMTSMASVGQSGARGDLLVVVANYEFNDNAVWLKNFFTPHFPTLLIDASSPEPPAGSDRIIANNGYRGLWNDAVGQAIEGKYEWLFFIASDVQLVRSKLMIHCLRWVADEPSISLWTPSIVPESRHAYRTCTHRPASIVRGCGAVEGFCFLARTSILKLQHPVSEENRYGFGIDMATSVLARAAGSVVVDDRVTIFHPARKSEHKIDEHLADQLGFAYLDRCGLDPLVTRAIDHAEYRAKLGRSMPLHGTYRSLDLDCHATAKDPFLTSDCWGVCHPSMDGSAQVRRADLTREAIPFGDHEFDYVLAFHLLDSIPLLRRSAAVQLPLHALMNEIFRVLKPGGLLLAIGRIVPSGDQGEVPPCGVYCSECRLSEWFCGDSPPAARNGFSGAFHLERQSLQADGSLLTLMRALG